MVSDKFYGNLTLNLRASDFSKFRSFNRRFLFRGKFGQCLFYCFIMEMCHSAIYICELCNTSYGRVGIPVWCITTIVPGAPIVWRTAIDLIASKALPPALRIIVASIPQLVLSCHGEGSMVVRAHWESFHRYPRLDMDLDVGLNMTRRQHQLH